MLLGGDVEARTVGGDEEQSGFVEPLWLLLDRPGDVETPRVHRVLCEPVTDRQRAELPLIAGTRRALLVVAS